jgi:ketopantoate reductase
MRVLIVGAGAVGQVYGRHMRLGGADVSFLVKEKYAEECRRGFVLYPLNRSRARRTEPVRLDRCGVVTSAAEAGKETWDTVVLTVASTALREGTWLDELAANVGGATLVALQPGLRDRGILAARWGEKALVAGMISMISYHAPLPGETRFPEPGMAYWFPPLGPSPFSGPEERLLPVLALLRAGGMPVKRHADVPRANAVPNALMMPLLVTLEAAGWSFQKVRESRELVALGVRAAREALRLAVRESGAVAPFSTRFFGPLFVRFLTRLAPLVVPLDVETYLKVHFTKVGPQTRQFMRMYMELGEKEGQEVGAMKELVARAGWQGC